LVAYARGQMRNARSCWGDWRGRKAGACTQKRGDLVEGPPLKIARFRRSLCLLVEVVKVGEKDLRVL